eukprot:scaffold97546_cov84-Phaeocystis_antarctica.AAC.2
MPSWATSPQRCFLAHTCCSLANPNPSATLALALTLTLTLTLTPTLTLTLTLILTLTRRTLAARRACGALGAAQPASEARVAYRAAEARGEGAPRL